MQLSQNALMKEAWFLTLQRLSDAFPELPSFSDCQILRTLFCECVRSTQGRILFLNTQNGNLEGFVGSDPCLEFTRLSNGVQSNINFVFCVTHPKKKFWKCAYRILLFSNNYSLIDYMLLKVYTLFKLGMHFQCNYKYLYLFKCTQMKVFMIICQWFIDLHNLINPNEDCKTFTIKIILNQYFTIEYYI